jgi:hypothetical protein
MPPAIPESTKTSLGQRLRQRQRERWPGLASVDVRFRSRFAYIDGEFEGGDVLPLCRLRYAGSASLWGFAVYLASRDGYQDSVLPSGLPIGTPEEALDCACAPAGCTSTTRAPGRPTSHQPAPDPARTSIRQYGNDSLIWPR